jgi:tetratricopeptide (TPR) repeat protein
MHERSSAFPWRCALAATLAFASAACATSRTPSSKGARTPLEEGAAAVVARDCQTARIKAREAQVAHVEPEALFIIGQCDELEGQPDAAIEAYEHALAIDPLRVDISLRLAQLELDLGRNEEALRVAKAAAALTPDRPEIHVLMAESYERLGENVKAERAFAVAAAAFHKAVAAHPDDAVLRNRYAHALAVQGKDELAKSEYLDAIGLANGDQSVLEEAAHGLALLGDTAGCIHAADRALELPKTALEARLLATRARCKHTSKDIAGACVDAEASLALSPDALLHLETAKWREQLGDRLACKQHYEEAAKLSTVPPVMNEAKLGIQRCGTPTM